MHTHTLSLVLLALGALAAPCVAGTEGEGGGEWSVVEMYSVDPPLSSAIAAGRGGVWVGHAAPSQGEFRAGAIWTSMGGPVVFVARAALDSVVTSTDGLTFGGWVSQEQNRRQAALWRSMNDEDLVILEPSADDVPDVRMSHVYGVDGDAQVGFVSLSGREHASLWRGSAQSWVDLHP